MKSRDEMNLEAARMLEKLPENLSVKDKMAIPVCPMPSQDAAVRCHNMKEVALGYGEDQAVLEAKRCLDCKNKPCVALCPVSIDIPRFVGFVAQRKFREALDVILESSLLPSICGRVCPQENQCQKNCTVGKAHKNVDEAVAIGRIERFVADWAMENGISSIPPVAPDSGKKVAVVGSGPASIAAAADLRKAGHDVYMFEALHKTGGVLVYGIPEFRLPKALVEREIGKLKDMGVHIETNLMKAYDEKDSQTPLYHAKRVAVFGGGNVAMDAARTALRLKADDVTIIYRRTREEMPARKEEVEHAHEEGVNFLMLSQPVEITADEKGRVNGVVVRKCELGDADESGRRRPVEIAGSDYLIPFDCVIVAIGNASNPLIKMTTPEIEVNKRGNFIVNEETGETSIKGVYAGGDIVLGAATVILAMGQGRKAAKAMNEYLERK